MTRHGHWWILLLTCWLLAPGAGRASTFIPPMPADPSAVDMYLLTVGRGPQPHAMFGHTILRVVDRSARLDMNFNWGMFDFHAAGFLWKFYIGDLQYFMAISDFPSLVQHYRGFEKRRVIQERLVLTDMQKLRLMERIIWNSRPENLSYQYSQFRDNCSTKPRDHLDEAIGGQIRKFYESRPAAQDFRWYIREGAMIQPWAWLGLDSIMNDYVDRPISMWEEMFIPAALREHLRNMPAFDDNGRPVPGRNLLEGTQVIIDLPEAGHGADPYYFAALVLLLPLLPGLISYFRSTSASEASERDRALRWLGLPVLIYGVWAGFWGSALLFNWLVSLYVEAKHNALLWLYWPLDWVWVWAGWRVLRGRPVTGFIVPMLMELHVTATLTAGLLAATGIISQSILGHYATGGLTGLIICGTLFVTVRSVKSGDQHAGH